MKKSMKKPNVILRWSRQSHSSLLSDPEKRPVLQQWPLSAEVTRLQPKDGGNIVGPGHFERLP